MNNPCENKSYRAKLLLSINFDDIEFTSINNYEFEINKGFVMSEYELEKEAKMQFIDEHQDIFVDVDLKIEVISININ